MNNCEGEYVYIGVAYDNVDLCHPYSSIVLHAKIGSGNQFRSESDHFFPGNQQGRFASYRTGHCIRIEVNMAARSSPSTKTTSACGIGTGHKSARVALHLHWSTLNVVMTIESAHHC
jgi:hypothetical protein